MYKKLTVGMAVVMTGIALTTMFANTVFATADPDTVGKVTKQANEEYRSDDREPGASETGRHASNPTGDGPNDVGCGDDPGRCGLAFNRNNEEHDGSPQETIKGICEGTNGQAAGCSALEED